VAEFAGRTSVAIPFHNHLTAEEIDYVAEVPRARWGRCNSGSGSGVVPGLEIRTATRHCLACGSYSVSSSLFNHELTMP